jgi:hypothetical protein
LALPIAAFIFCVLQQLKEQQLYLHRGLSGLGLLQTQQLDHHLVLRNHRLLFTRIIGEI